MAHSGRSEAAVSCASIPEAAPKQSICPRAIVAIGTGANSIPKHRKLVYYSDWLINQLIKQLQWTNSA